MNEALTATRTALGELPAWLVGGALRDRLIGRETPDLDVVLRGDVSVAARTLARASGGHAFALSDAFGAWRVVAARGGWQVDLSPLRGASIEHDLALRDFTINALAEPLAGGALIDPHGGVEDLRGGRLRMVSPEAFGADPLRVLRLARLACELSLAADPATVAAASAHAAALSSVAAERVWLELRRIVRAQRVLEGLELMAQVQATAVLLPELEALHGVAQTRYHHLDVHDHTFAVLAEVVALQRHDAHAQEVLGPHAAAVWALLAEPLSDELTRGDALRLGALLHDVAKPQTRVRLANGRVGFPGHDLAGAHLAETILRRLRASRRLTDHVAALARNHLRLGFLVHAQPLDRRAVHRYLRACEPVEVDVTVLSVADRLATRGRQADQAIAMHVELAGELLGEALAWRAAPRRQPLVRGDELASALGVDRGPRLGELLEQLEEAAWAGEIATREEAITHARALLKG